MSPSVSHCHRAVFAVLASSRHQRGAGDPRDDGPCDLVFGVVRPYELVSGPRDEPSFDVLQAETRRSACRVRRERKQGFLDQTNRWERGEVDCSPSRDTGWRSCIPWAVPSSWWPRVRPARRGTLSSRQWPVRLFSGNRRRCRPRLARRDRVLVCACKEVRSF